MKKIISLVEKELNSAYDKFNDFNSYHEGYAVIKEELDELWDEVKKKKPDKEKMGNELIQIIAMSIRFIQDLIARQGDNNGKRTS